MSEKVSFGSKISLIAATVGSAVGLGNVWRFPNEVQENGGAAFLVVYIGCILLLGIPVMLAEFSLGRGTGLDTVGAFKRLTPSKPWWGIGVISLLASYMITCFYMVVAAWTMHYLWGSIDGSLYAGLTEGMSALEMKDVFTGRFADFVGSAWSPMLWIGIVLAVNMFILLKGVKSGIERMSNALMPLLFVILLVLCGVSLSLPGAGEGVEFFLRPDFSKLNAGVFVSALGQAFFSLSLGMGILITYSSYFPKKDNLTTTALSVSFCDFMVALLMGFIIFPAVKSFGIGGDGSELQSAALVFVTLPEVFAQMPLTQVWSALFFLLLVIAALTSTVSISEVSILFFQEKMRFSRKKATLLVILPLLIFSPLCSLSQGVLSDMTLFGKNLFDFLDSTTTNYMLPIAALLTCIYVGWVVPKDFFRNEVTNNGKVAVRFFPIVRVLVRYLAPILILSVFAYQLMS